MKTTYEDMLAAATAKGRSDATEPSMSPAQAIRIQRLVNQVLSRRLEETIKRLERLEAHLGGEEKHVGVK